MNQEQPPRRDFLRYVGTMAALSTPALHAAAREENRVSFAPIFDKSEKPEKTEPPRDSWDKRVGVAVVGLGRIAIDEMLPAYRSQYEALDRALVSMIRDKKLGTLKECNPVNSRNMGDPQHWRLKKAMAGGGALPDIGIYCINAARFLSGEEPSEVFGSVWSTPGDARFREVEESCQFVLRFPSGFSATCSTNYCAHKSQMFRLNGFDAWAEMDSGYAYHGNKLRITRVVDGKDQASDIPADKKNQFTLMIDHFASRIQQNKDVHTPGEEGLQDQRIMEAIYESARSGRVVKLTPPAGKTRGPQPESVDWNPSR